jgi:hypothetical protein
MKRVFRKIVKWLDLDDSEYKELMKREGWKDYLIK